MEKINAILSIQNLSSLNNNKQEKGIIDLITCKLCKGYLIDAVTIDLCMHSFCRPCAIRYIREKPKCPECNLEIKDKRFLNRLKTDSILQSIVYKLVPGLYENEMARRRIFYAARPSPTHRYKSEMFGDVPPSKTIKPEDKLNVSLTWLKDNPITTYLLCRADSTILLLKKLIIAKFGLEGPIKIYYGGAEIFYDLTALLDVAVLFNWLPESRILSLSFREHDQRKDMINSSSPQNSDPDPWNGP